MTHSSPSPKRVLIVEDEDSVAGFYRRALAATHCVLYRARSGEEAVSLVETTSFDVIVSDLSLPGLGGEELLRSVRERDRDVPIVVVTGKPEIESAITAVECRALRYLVKPIGPKVLIETVMRAMESNVVSLQSLHGLHPLAATAGVKSKGAELDRLLDRLVIEYQPVVRPLEGLVLGYEARVRTKHNRLYHEEALLPAVQELGGVKELGRRVRGAIAAGLRELLPKESLVFARLHVEELENAGLYSRADPLFPFAGRVVVGLADEARVDGAEERIHELRSQGFLFSLDDLGSSYDALTNLIQLEPDFARVNLSLVQDIDKCASKRMRVSSLVAACRQLGIQLICEGVETEEEGNCLLDLGAELLQGYFFAKPKPSFHVEDGERWALRIERLNQGRRLWNE
jgi:EAL domain-containing protein (putative c-di-GMP-specific phosphodiesterase class I)